MLSLGEIATILGAAPPAGGRVTPARVTHDSRVVEPGDLFIAIRGTRADGHDFLDEAFRRGACGAIVSDPHRAPWGTSGVIAVEDTVRALQQLASVYRARLRAPLIAITGSYGKTTTRTLLAHLLRTSRRVHEAPENYNTEIGLPLALLSMPEDAEVGVFELGTLRSGEIAFLASILGPSAAVVTAVGPSHLGGFGSLDAIADEKWSLVRALDARGVAFVNADCPHLRARIRSAACAVTTVGLTTGDLRGRVESAVPTLTLRADEPPLRLETPLLGEQNATNVLLAAACALHFGVPPAEVERGARDVTPPDRRLRPRPFAHGVLLDDTYNANPASMTAALRVLASYGEPRSRRVFVFGDMLDLGDASDRFHREVAELAIALGIDLILPVGERAAAACGGLAACNPSLMSADDRAAALRTELAEERNVVLVKGSRALALDGLVDRLLGEPPRRDTAAG